MESVRISIEPENNARAVRGNQERTVFQELTESLPEQTSHRQCSTQLTGRAWSALDSVCKSGISRAGLQPSELQACFLYSSKGHDGCLVSGVMVTEASPWIRTKGKLVERDNRGP